MTTPPRAIIAVVDDDPVARSVATAILENAGYLVTGYDSGSAFLGVAAKRQPTAMLLDFHLGDMDAHDVVMRLMNLGIVIPTVVLTSDPQNARVVDLVTTGLISEVLAKPRGVIEAVRAIEVAIAGAR